MGRLSIEKRLDSSESKAINFSSVPYDVRLLIIGAIALVSSVGVVHSHKGNVISTKEYIFCGKPLEKTDKNFCDKWKDPYFYSSELSEIEMDRDAKILSDSPATAPLQGWINLGTGMGFLAIAAIAKTISEDRRITDPHRKILEMRDFEISRIDAAFKVAEENKLLNGEQYQNYNSNELPEFVDINIDKDDVVKNLFQLFSNRKIVATYYGTVDAPSFLRVKAGVDSKTRYSVIEKMGEDIKIACGLTVTPFISPQPGYIAFDIAKPSKERRIAYYNDYRSKINRESLTLPIGINIENELVEADMSASDSVCPHFLIGGTTRCGKSQLVTVFLISLMERFSPKELQIIIIDPKQVDFRIFQKMPWVKNYECFVEDAMETLDNVLAESQERYSLFAKVGARNLSEYQAMGYEKPRLVIIYDEYADHICSSKENKQKIEETLPRIAAISAAAGVHLVFATQRPDKDVVTPLIRSNLPGRIALRTKSDADGAIIMGRECKSNELLGKGDLIFDSAEFGYERLQSLYIGDISDIKKRIDDLLAKYENDPETKSKNNTPKSPKKENSSDLESRIKDVLSSSKHHDRGLFGILEPKNTEEMLIILRFALSAETNINILVIKLWGDLRDDPPGNAEKVMQNYKNLVVDWMKELEKQGYTHENNWGVELESYG